MKLFLCTWGTNYGLGCCVIAANSEEDADKLVNDQLMNNPGQIWPNFELNEIITPEEEGILDIPFYQHY